MLGMANRWQPSGGEAGGGIQIRLRFLLCVWQGQVEGEHGWGCRARAAEVLLRWMSS
ncbi:hypothetical protein BKA80DRAFT_270724 [Phyllosticta citrichinensis]